MRSAFVRVVSLSTSLWSVACAGSSGPSALGPASTSSRAAEPVCGPPIAKAEAQVAPHVVFAEGEPLRIESALLMNGRRIRPPGEIGFLGTLCTAMAARPPDLRQVAVACGGDRDAELEHPGDRSVRIVDLDRGTQRMLPFPDVFYGVSWTPDGSRLVVSLGRESAIAVLDAQDEYRVVHRVPLLGTIAYGVAVTPDGRFALAAESHSASVAQVDLQTGRVVRRYPTLAFPLAIQVLPDGSKAYVSCVGDFGVTVISLAEGRTLGTVATGKNPQGMALDDRGILWVADSDSDRITRIDTRIDRTVDTIPLREADGLGGIDPVTVRFSRDGRRAYVPCSGEGSVRVLESSTGRSLGRIQALDFPQDVLEVGDGLIVLSGKGLNTLLQPEPEDYDRALQRETPDVTVINHRATLQVIRPVPDEDTLRTWDREVAQGLDARGLAFDVPCEDWAGDLPVRTGTASARVRHVIYVVKENKTYDSLLGDLVGPEGDAWHEPAYALFGESVPAAVVPAKYAGQALDVTPNLHALAREFCNLANFYNDADRSTQGHQWATGGRLTDFFEKVVWQIQDGVQFSIPGADTLSQPEGGHVIDHLVAHGKTVRIYGEFASFVEHVAEYVEGGWISYALDFPPGMTDLLETAKVQAFVKDVQAGLLRDFTYIQLMNDHTYGFSENRPHPAFMVADNDRAVGLVVEAVAQSPFWDSTVIFILEDDPQDTPDHVDPHRSLLLVVGGPVRRGYTSTTLHHYPSLHATAMGLLGLPPLSRRDALAAPFFECFDDRPHPEGFTARPMDPKLADKREWIVGKFEVLPEVRPLMERLVAESRRLDLEDIDRAPGLGPILWHGITGGDRPFPRGGAPAFTRPLAVPPGAWAPVQELRP